MGRTSAIAMAGTHEGNLLPPQRPPDVLKPPPPMGVVSRGHTFLWKSRRADGAFPRRWATHGLSSSMERNPPCRNIRGFRRPSRRLKSAS